MYTKTRQANSRNGAQGPELAAVQPLVYAFRHPVLCESCAAIGLLLLKPCKGITAGLCHKHSCAQSSSVRVVRQNDLESDEASREGCCTCS